MVNGQTFGSMLNVSVCFILSNKCWCLVEWFAGVLVVIVNISVSSWILMNTSVGVNVGV